MLMPRPDADTNAPAAPAVPPPSAPCPVDPAGPTDFDLLRYGEIGDCALTRHGSNYTYLAELTYADRYALAIYKPRQGEWPLWDFPDGTLYRREYAAYLLSRILGWNFIPRTVIRDGPGGIGSLQLYIDHNPRENYYTMSRAGFTPTEADQLRAICCFDLVANNTDRKPEHIIRDHHGKLWGIDHGLTFHADLKIRTAIWDFESEPIPERLLHPLRQLAHHLLAPSPPAEVAELLSLLDAAEARALLQRLQWLLDEGAYPGLPGRRRNRRRNRR